MALVKNRMDFAPGERILAGSDSTPFFRDVPSPARCLPPDSSASTPATQSQLLGWCQAQKPRQYLLDSRLPCQVAEVIHDNVSVMADHGILDQPAPFVCVISPA